MGCSGLRTGVLFTDGFHLAMEAHVTNFRAGDLLALATESENSIMMKCKVFTARSVVSLESSVNEWLAAYPIDVPRSQFKYSSCALDDPDMHIVNHTLILLYVPLEAINAAPIPMKDTAPFITPTRVKRVVTIQEINDPPAPNTFDTTVNYSSDALPEWFAPLQPILEDRTVDGMGIKIGGGRVLYNISLEKVER